MTLTKQCTELDNHHEVEVERTIGFLKNRWQSLKGLPLEIKDAEGLIPCMQWIAVCCYLHNFVHSAGDDGYYLDSLGQLRRRVDADMDIQNVRRLRQIDGDYFGDDDDDVLPTTQESRVVNSREERELGEAKRTAIKNALCMPSRSQ